MGNFNRGGFGGGRGGRPSFGGGRRFGGNDGGFDKEMHKATCSECGNACEVPFRPTNGKPVYCNDCFKGKSGGDDRAPRRDFDRNDRPMRNNFNSSMGSNGDSGSSKKIEELSSKVDRLIEMVKSLSGVKPAQEKATLKEIVVSSLPKKEVEVKVSAPKASKKKTSSKKSK
jgi:CxxC-x17-CxxC domain-containing protein